MKTYASDWWMRYRQPIRTLLFPARAAWSIANRAGWLSEPPIATQPYLHPEALEYWRQAIAQTDVYLEYGAGGSTIEAVRSVEHVFSVETDQRYLAAVEREVAARGGSAAFHPIWADIGWTTQWGQPLVMRANSARVKRWSSYPRSPWLALETLGLTPGFVVIDGRFRLASALESLLRLPEGVECRFLLDDFEQRATAYAPLMAFVEDIEYCGDALGFRRASTFSPEDCLRVLGRAYADPL